MASVQKRFAGELGSSRAESEINDITECLKCAVGRTVQKRFAATPSAPTADRGRSLDFQFKDPLHDINVSCISGGIPGKRGRSTGDPSGRKTPYLVNRAKQSAGGKKDEAQWRKGGVNYLGGWTVRDDPDSPKARVNGNVPPLFPIFNELIWFTWGLGHPVSSPTDLSQG